jgi:glutaredoxin 3
MYKTPVCPYCQRAKALFNKKGVADQIQEIDITTEPHLRDEMMSKTGGRKTVPQIFINDTHVGGFDDLHALDQAGKLDALLES